MVVGRNKKDGFEFESIMYPFYKKDAIIIRKGGKSITEYIQYINDNELQQAIIFMPDLMILESCPSLKYLKICPSFDAAENFDFSPLYKRSEIRLLNCINEYGDRDQYIAQIDYAQIKGLRDLSFSDNKGSLNYNKVDTLRSLSVGGFKGRYGDLTDLFQSKVLDTLELREGREYSLNGIEKTEKMQCLYLYYNRALKDISALAKVKNTLKALRIQNCPKITDFSVLEQLENLELLEITGGNSVKDLKFLDNMRKLQTFIFNINVLDGDLLPCMRLSYAYCGKNRKHYNLKDKELPKGKCVRGNEDIETWRRLE